MPRFRAIQVIYIAAFYCMGLHLTKWEFNHILSCEKFSTHKRHCERTRSNPYNAPTQQNWIGHVGFCTPREWRPKRTERRPIKSKP